MYNCQFWPEVVMCRFCELYNIQLDEIQNLFYRSFVSIGLVRSYITTFTCNLVNSFIISVESYICHERIQAVAIGPFIFNCGGYGSPQNVILANKDASRFLSFKKVSALWRAVLRTINDNMVCILTSIALSFLQGRKNRKGLTC